MPIKITPSQNRRLHQLLNDLGLMEDKKELVRSFTNGRAESSKELSVDEAKRLIFHLEGIHKTDDPADRRRKKVLAICYNMGWIFGNSPEDQKMNTAKINAFLKRYGYLKKPSMPIPAWNCLSWSASLKPLRKSTKRLRSTKLWTPSYRN